MNVPANAVQLYSSCTSIDAALAPLWIRSNGLPYLSTAESPVARGHEASPGLSLAAYRPHIGSDQSPAVRAPGISGPSPSTPVQLPEEPSESPLSSGPTAGEVTRILQSAAAGDRAALDRALPFLYDDLRQVARRQLAREYGEPPINPTTLVHEAYFKLAGNAPRAANRAHLLAIAAHAMRQVLVDHARERQAEKRGPAWIRTTLTDAAWMTELDPATILALDDALERLEPRQRQVVECRFFGGLDDDEIAESLGVTTRTVRRDWVKARAWLNRWLNEEPGS